MLFLQIINQDHFGLYHWLGMGNKHFLTPLNSKKLKSNENQMQIPSYMQYGHMWQL
jgi:hypothetical protein